MMIVAGETSVDFVRFLVSLIVQENFANLHTVLIIFDSANKSPLQLSYLDGVTEGMERLMENEAIVTSWLDLARLNGDDFYEKMLANVEIGSQGYISILSNTSLFIAAKYYSTQESLLRQRDKRILMLTDNESPAAVLSSRYLYMYPTHLLLRSIIGSHIELWTQQFTGKSESNKAQLFGNVSWNNHLYPTEKLIFPDKIGNLKGRNLNVSSITYLPYTFIKAVNDGEGMVDEIGSNRKNIFYEGTEANLIIEFCRIRNCTIKADVRGLDEWGTIYPNGSSDGLIGALYTRQAVLGIGCLYNWYPDEFDVSDIISKSSVTLLVPAPKKLPAYLSPFLPFSYPMWAMVISIPVLTAIFFHFLQTLAEKRDPGRKKHTFNETALQIVSIFFLQAYVRDRFVTRAIRFYIISLLLASILLDVLYSSKLKAQMAVPQYTSSIDMVYKFAKSNMKWFAPADAWVDTIRNSTIAFEQILAQNFEIMTNPEMKELTSSGKYGFGIERLNSGNYAFGSFLNSKAMDKLQILKDNIFFDYTRALAIRGWPLLPYFNKFAREMSETGLMMAWEGHYVRKYLDKGTHVSLLLSKVSSHHVDTEPETLNLNHVSGMFLLLLSGYVLSLTSFICEISRNYYNKRNEKKQTKRRIQKTQWKYYSRTDVLSKIRY